MMKLPSEEYSQQCQTDLRIHDWVPVIEGLHTVALNCANLQTITLTFADLAITFSNPIQLYKTVQWR